MMKDEELSGRTSLAHLPTLSEAHQTVIEQDMQIILLASNTVRGFKSRSIPLVESETREVWSELIRHFYVSGFNELTCSSTL